MKLGTILVGIIVISTFIIPILLFYWMRMQKEKLIRKTLLNSSKEKNTRIIAMEIWDHSGIALTESGMVFSIEDHRVNQKVKVIDLNSITSCRVVHNQDTIESQEAGERVSLDFTGNGNQLFTNEIVFYSSKRTGGILSGQLQLANKWQALLTSKRPNEVGK